MLLFVLLVLDVLEDVGDDVMFANILVKVFVVVDVMLVVVDVVVVVEEVVCVLDVSKI